MEFAIGLGIGLIGGIALLIWALTERSKRTKAEKAVIAYTHQLEDREYLLKQRDKYIVQLKVEFTKQEEQIYALRRTIDATREQLKASNDPKTVESWLNAEMLEQP